jgi:beta-lactamase class A
MLRSCLAASLCAALVFGPALAGAQKGPSEYEVFDDPRLEQQHQLDRIAPFEDLAPLWDYIDTELEAEVRAALEDLGLSQAARRKQLAAVLVDVSRPERPRVASINGDAMLYAASLPKIAILLGAFEKIAEGNMELDSETERELVNMIRVSSNASATAMMNRVGKEYIARVLLSPRYRLYDPEHNGGLWVGKEYSKAGVWKRDPIHGLSHGATAMQVARFFYMMQTGRLVTPEYSAKMKDIMSNPALYHKFVGALMRVNPAAALFRKSGSWSTFHSDAILVERGRRAYIAVALADSPQGGRWLKKLAVAFDGIIFGKSWLHRLAGAKPEKG